MVVTDGAPNPIVIDLHATFVSSRHISVGVSIMNHQSNRESDVDRVCNGVKHTEDGTTTYCMNNLMYCMYVRSLKYRSDMHSVLHAGLTCTWYYMHV